MVTIRAPLEADVGTPATRSPRVVEFLHPAYPDGANLLLGLYALDDGGIDYDTAHAACCIIANNSWGLGFLAERRPAADGRVTYEPVPRDQILSAASYYFCVGTDPGFAFPIVTQFDDWEFPHDMWAGDDDDPDGERGGMDTMPWVRLRQAYQRQEDMQQDEEGGWDERQAQAQALTTTIDPKTIVRLRDRSCRITLHSEATEVAHLVPSALESWFDRNRMSQYCSNKIPTGGRSTIDDDRNALLLRRDLHWLLDANRFVFVPKFDDQGHPVLLIHVLQPSKGRELEHLYHNRTLHPLRSVAPAFLHAHFALSIFKNCSPLASGGEQQLYKIRIFDPVKFKYQVKEMSRKQLRQYSTRSRSTSPSKRARPADDVDDNLDNLGEEMGTLVTDDCNESSCGTDGEVSWDDGLSEDTGSTATEVDHDDSHQQWDEEERRGRSKTRKRGWDEFSEGELALRSLARSSKATFAR